MIPQQKADHTKTARRPEAAQDYLATEFFNELSKMAEGNATVAMIYWIRSIQKIEGSFIYLQPVEFQGIQYLSELDSNTLFVLNAFVKHDVLTAGELAGDEYF